MATETHNMLVNFKANTAAASANVSKFQKRLKGFAKAGFITGFAALGGTALFSLTKNLAKAAATAETTNRAFERTFNNLASTVRGDVNEISDSFLRATSDIKKGLVSFQSFFVGLGFGAKEASKFSVSVQKASLDLASFYGLTDTGAQKRFISALAGSPEVLDQFGINLKQAALQIELYNMGIKTTVQNTDELTKTQARLNIINRSMTASGILGDVVRNVDSYGNKVKALNSSWTEFKEVIGRYVLPAMSFVIASANTLLKTITGLQDRTEEYYEKKAKASDLAGKTLLKEAGITKKNFADEKSYIIAIDAFTKKLAKSKEASLEIDRRRASNKRLTQSFGYEQAQPLLQKIDDHLLFQAKLYDNSKAKVDEINSALGTQATMFDVVRDIDNKKAAAAKVIQSRLDGQAATIEEIQKTQEETIADGLKRLKVEREVAKISAEGADKIKAKIKELSEEAKVYSDNMLKGFKQNDSEKATAELADLTLKINLLKKALVGVKEESIDVSDILNIDIESESSVREFAFFDQITTTLKDNLTGIEDIVVEYKDRFDRQIADMGDGMAQGFSSAFGDGVAGLLSGTASFKNAFRLAMNSQAALMSADFAAKALYFAILGAGMSAGIIATGGATAPSAQSAFKSAAIFGAGAVTMGGLAAAIPNARTGGGSAGGRNGSFGGRSTGQSSFNQQLVAEVSGDQLRFVLQESDRARFRRNG